MVKATTAASSTGTALQPWQERLGALAVAAAAAEVVTGRFLTFRAGQMRYNDVPVADNSLHCVVVGSIAEHHYYEENFDPDNITSPVCFAFGVPDALGVVPPMVPHDNVVKKQNATCDGCPQAEWGSSPRPNSRGKACKQVRRIAVVPADALKQPDKLAAASVAYARIPVTSVRNWSTYVNLLAAQRTPPLGVVTRMWLTPDAKTQFQVNFEIAARITDGDIISALLDKNASVMKQIAFPYEKPNAEAEQPKTTAGKAAARRNKPKM